VAFKIGRPEFFLTKSSTFHVHGPQIVVLIIFWP